MIGAAREAMATQQIHHWLNAVWAVVAEANRYFAGEAPWALAKTDPARQKTVLYVTAEVVRQIAILTQPAMPAGVGQAARQPRHPRGRARLSRRSAAPVRIAPGTHAAGAARGVPALRRTDGRRERCWSTATAIWIFRTLPTISTASSRAPRRPASAAWSRSRPGCDGSDELLAIAERYDNVYCSVGTHPHHADEEDGISPDELIELTGHPKVVALGEAGLDYFYEHGSRGGAGARLSRAISPPPARPACRS